MPKDIAVRPQRSKSDTPKLLAKPQFLKKPESPPPKTSHSASSLPLENSNSQPISPSNSSTSLTPKTTVTPNHVSELSYTRSASVPLPMTTPPSHSAPISPNSKSPRNRSSMNLKIHSSTEEKPLGPQLTSSLSRSSINIRSAKSPRDKDQDKDIIYSEERKALKERKSKATERNRANEKKTFLRSNKTISELGEQTRLRQRSWTDPDSLALSYLEFKSQIQLNKIDALRDFDQSDSSTASPGRRAIMSKERSHESSYSQLPAFKPTQLKVDLSKSTTPYSFNNEPFSERDFALKSVIGKFRNGLVCSGKKKKTL